MDVLSAIEQKRAVRHFHDEPLPDEVITAILDAGRRAQSGMNGQPWHFVAITNKETLNALAQCGEYAGHLAGAALGIALVGTPQAGLDFDLGQAAAYIQLAAQSLGVGSCLASMWQPEKAKAILGIPTELHFTIALSFGYAAKRKVGKRKGNGRKSLDEVVRWQQW